MEGGNVAPVAGVNDHYVNFDCYISFPFNMLLVLTVLSCVVPAYHRRPHSSGVVQSESVGDAVSDGPVSFVAHCICLGHSGEGARNGEGLIWQEKLSQTGDKTE